MRRAGGRRMALFEIEPGEIAGHQARLVVNGAMLSAASVVAKRDGNFVLTVHLVNIEKPAISVEILGEKIDGVLARLRTLLA
jgi:hypothetical protein